MRSAVRAPWPSRHRKERDPHAIQPPSLFSTCVVASIASYSQSLASPCDGASHRRRSFCSHASDAHKKLGSLQMTPKMRLARQFHHPMRYYNRLVWSPRPVHPSVRHSSCIPSRWHASTPRVNLPFAVPHAAGCPGSTRRGSDMKNFIGFAVLVSGDESRLITADPCASLGRSKHGADPVRFWMQLAR